MAFSWLTLRESRGGLEWGKPRGHAELPVFAGEEWFEVVPVRQVKKPVVFFPDAWDLVVGQETVPAPTGRPRGEWLFQHRQRTGSKHTKGCR